MKRTPCIFIILLALLSRTYCEDVSDIGTYLGQHFRPGGDISLCIEITGDTSPDSVEVLLKPNGWGSAISKSLPLQAMPGGFKGSIPSLMKVMNEDKFLRDLGSYSFLITLSAKSGRRVEFDDMRVDVKNLTR